MASLCVTAPGVRGMRCCRAALVLASALYATLAAAEEPPAGTTPSYTGRWAGLASDELLRRGDGGVPGLARVRPVLQGVLYRAGFEQGDTTNSGLSEAQRTALCQAGFSGAFYVDFAKRTPFGVTDCGNNAFDYQGGLSMKPRALMRRIGVVIDDPDLGPLLLHCRWGVHSSGAIAAMALVQFCGWTVERAKAYWNASRDGAPCAGSCEQWIDERFDRFKLDPSLVPDPGEQERLCPREPEADLPPEQEGGSH
jgi:hypothetical protein